MENSDTMKVKSLISNTQSVFHKEAYQLNSPMSPHAAAERDNIRIELSKITPPKTENYLIIEGAGGLLVPLNNQDFILDIIPNTDTEVVIVSRHYLGSINHTLMTIKTLKDKNINIKGIIFSGEENKDTESIILKMSGINLLFRINEEKYFDKEIIRKYAQQITLWAGKI